MTVAQGFLESCIAIKKCAEWCSFCKNQLRKSAFSETSLAPAVMEFDPPSSLCIGYGFRRGSPIICCPSLWCRKVSSCIRENLESRGVGTIHSRLVHPCCTQCKVSTVGNRWPQNLLFTTRQMVFCSTEALTRSSAGVM